MFIVISVLVGLGIFLYGMRCLEGGLQTLGSDRVKLWLGRSTSHPVSSVATGTAITAVLQSSSMVSLIVLAFASSGMIPLFNAVGVILGANLGTTFTGWVVATIGFKMDLEAFALPFFGLGALVLVFSRKGGSRYSIAGIVMGLGLLIFGLSLMKEAVEDLPKILSPDFLRELSLPMFLLIGMVLTAIIQSSSAMTLVALTALNAGIIDLSSAGALVVGADIGTTSTTALGSLKSAPIAKRLALAHVTYNLVVDAIAFIVMIPLLPWVLELTGVTDPLYGLVLFHSSFNLLGLFIFVPFLKRFSHWLSGFFRELDSPNTDFIHATSSHVPEAALVSLKNELLGLMVRVMAINLRNLKIDTADLDSPDEIKERFESSFSTSDDFTKRYELAKQLEGEMFHYAGKVSARSRQALIKQKIETVMDSARDAVYSMKTLKDEREKLVEFRRIQNKLDVAESCHSIQKRLYEVLNDLIFAEHGASYVEQKLHWLRAQNEKLHNTLHDALLKDYLAEDHHGNNLASVLNTNREIWHSNKSLIDAIEHFQALRQSEV